LLTKHWTDELQVSAEPEAEDVVWIMDAEWVHAGWKERMEKEWAIALAAKSKTVEHEDAASKRAPPAMQESAIKVNKVEDMVALMVEQVSSKALSTSVSSSGVKVSISSSVRCDTLIPDLF
jgi:hypothetical protein